jgi:isoleucyl-tRNA synthetase
VFDAIFEAMVRWAAPVLVFTAEEGWGSRWPGAESVHLAEWPEVPAVAADRSKWGALRALRAEVSEAIEPLRRDKVIKSSLEAEVFVNHSYSGTDLAELFISSTVHEGERNKISRTTNHKCGRCWRHLPEVTEDGDLCGRCDEVVHGG